MRLRNKTKHSLPIAGVKARANRIVIVPDETVYDEEKFEEIKEELIPKKTKKKGDDN